MMPLTSFQRISVSGPYRVKQGFVNFCPRHAGIEFPGVRVYVSLRMPDEQLRGLAARGQGLGGRHQVLHVGGQARVGEITAAFAQAGEVEAQDTDPPTGEGPGDVVDGPSRPWSR
jgi:hypothetical protein